MNKFQNFQAGRFNSSLALVEELDDPAADEHDSFLARTVSWCPGEQRLRSSATGRSESGLRKLLQSDFL
ncbi:unnamed protein product [Gongylonema pulchrum]|uniref:Uncharacterized protein n=1 Tax=Gongylonema pulchrum TaxID=637853 RepID=A0A183DZ45_9BILA|nr:unnamed protein product [Gongylonema pulchrum]